MARPLTRPLTAWALLADTVPFYPLYALLFADSGLSDAEISALLAIWSAVGILAEVPSGALADRYSRRAALVASGVLQAAGYAVWLLLPGFGGFATGFVLWGVGGTLVSGTREALLYDGLVAAGAEAWYARIQGRVTAAGQIAQVPTGLAAAALFPLGGYPLVGWVSVACCLGAAALASRLPEPPRTGTSGTCAGPDRYLATLRAGIGETTSRPGVRSAVLAVALVASLDTVEEYVPLLAGDWGVPTALVPLTVLAVPLAGAAGASVAGKAGRLAPWQLAALLGGALVLLVVADLPGHPLGLLGVAVCYGAYQVVSVVLDARLQERIEGPARATVTSVAGLGTDLACFPGYAAWAFGEVAGVAVLGLCVAAGLPRWLRAGHAGQAGHGVRRRTRASRGTMRA